MEEYIGKVTIRPFVQGYEWGPGVSKLILSLEEPIVEVEVANASITTNRVERNVTRAYISNETGNLVLELETTSAIQCGTPFIYDRYRTFHYHWVKKYPVIIEGLHIKVNEKEFSLSCKQDCAKCFVTPQYDLFTMRDTYTGEYYNPYKKRKEELTLWRAAYEPAELKGGEKNPLIIWLHGAGEGGEDVSIALYGNQVSALAEEKIQSYFTAGEQTGAYVLLVQCQTCWPDKGNGRKGYGNDESRYTEILMDTIKDYVDSNPDIDTNRIYLGGCSNGGYMTIQLLLHYPEYFAAAFPVCEAYAYTKFSIKDWLFTKDKTKLLTTKPLWFTKEKAKILATKPIWFVQAANDATIPAFLYGAPSYQAILREGAENCWYSCFENVTGMDDPGVNYYGHWSWIYLFHDQVSGVQNNELVLKGDISKFFGFVPDNMSGGGSQKAHDHNGTYDSIFEWLNNQRKS